MSVHNPHDHFFRDSFGRPEIARSYLQEYLPADLVSQLDLDHLVLQDSSFIDESLREHQSDLLYRTTLRDNERTVYLYFLFEHKSFPDELVALQLLRYMLRFWEEQVKRKEALAPMIPLVVYHGEKAWSVPTDFFSLLDAPEALRPHLLDFHYQLNDFSYLSDEEIRGGIWLRVCLSVLRAIYHPGLNQELRPLLALMFELWQKKTGVEYIRTILYYLTMATEKVSRETLEQALLVQGSQGEQLMTTIAQEYIQEGIEKGLQQGIEKGLQQGLEQGLQTMRTSILDLLAIRFDLATPELTTQLARIKDLETLRHLLRQAATADSITAVEQAVSKAVNEEAASS